jgi:hypothetical protein
MSRSFTFCLGWVVLSAAIAVSGCALPLLGGRGKPSESAPGPGQCTVELKPGGGQMKLGYLDVGGDSTVQQVLEKTGANRKFSRATVDLYRKLPSGEWHKMPCDYDFGRRQVDPLHDYHVQPGDRVVVSEDTSTGLEDLMKDQKGPLGSIFGS